MTIFGQCYNLLNNNVSITTATNTKGYKYLNKALIKKLLFFDTKLKGARSHNLPKISALANCSLNEELQGNIKTR